MNAAVFSLSELPEDNPIGLLRRRKVVGDQMLFAHIHLGAGCHVAGHRHPSEQISFLVSGKVRWTLGEPGTPGSRVVEIEAGSVVLLPSNVWHGVDAISDSVVIDLLAPPAAMGVDAQKT